MITAGSGRKRLTSSSLELARSFRGRCSGTRSRAGAPRPGDRWIARSRPGDRRATGRERLACDHRRQGPGPACGGRPGDAGHRAGDGAARRCQRPGAPAEPGRRRGRDRGRAGPAGQQRQRARPQPRSRRWPTTRSRCSQRVYDVNTVAPLALLQDAAARTARAGPARVVNVSSDAAVEAYARVGRLRLVQSGARPAHRRARGRAPASCAVYAFDPGDMATDLHQRGVPRRGHQRPRRAGERRAGAAAAGRRATLPSGRYRAADLRSGGRRARRDRRAIDGAIGGDRSLAPPAPASRCRPGSEAAEPPERRGRGARRRPAARRRGPAGVQPPALPRPARAAAARATCWSSTPPRPSRRRWTRSARRPARRRCTCPTRARRRPLGGGDRAGPTRPGPSADVARGRAARASRRGAAAAGRALPRPRRRAGAAVARRR